MNRVTKSLHLKHTSYSNPHGLADRANHSTAFDQAQLASYAMKMPEFAKIVNTREYSATSFLPKTRLAKHFCKLKTAEIPQDKLPFAANGREYVKFTQTWHNSNKLLSLPGFCGVKTGITSTAWSCLSVYFKNKQLNRNLITVVLGSRNIEYRWKDTRRLTLYANACLEHEHEVKHGPAKKIVTGLPSRFERPKKLVMSAQKRPLQVNTMLKC